ncbi:MAG: SUMF1/EgtB/PvdO family nonheme iron enzyme, partial [Candidatus Competibacterales bacterium]
AAPPTAPPPASVSPVPPVSPGGIAPGVPEIVGQDPSPPAPPEASALLAAVRRLAREGAELAPLQWLAKFPRPPLPTPLPGEERAVAVKATPLDATPQRYPLGNGRFGPEMVTVTLSPEVWGATGRLAVSRRPITYGDYDAFRRDTGRPRPFASRPHDALLAAMPVNYVTLEEAQAYIRWLSQRSGQVCEVPTASQWRILEAHLDQRFDVAPWRFDTRPAGGAGVAFHAVCHIPSPKLSRGPFPGF